MVPLTWFYVSFGAAVGLAVGLPLAWLSLRGLAQRRSSAAMALRRAELQLNRDTLDQRKAEHAAELELEREARLLAIELQKDAAERSYRVTTKPYEADEDDYVVITLEAPDYVEECVAHKRDVDQTTRSMKDRYSTWAGGSTALLAPADVLRRIEHVERRLTGVLHEVSAQGSRHEKSIERVLAEVRALAMRPQVGALGPLGAQPWIPPTYPAAGTGGAPYGPEPRIPGPRTFMEGGSAPSSASSLPG